MQHWHNGKQQYIESEVLDDFLNDIVAVYLKHNLSIGHEDSQGAFIIEGPERREQNISWLRSAEAFVD